MTVPNGARYRIVHCATGWVIQKRDGDRAPWFPFAASFSTREEAVKALKPTDPLYFDADRKEIVT